MREGTSRSPLGERLLRYVRLSWLRTVRMWRSFLHDQVTPVRLASHIALLFMAVAVIVLSRVESPASERRACGATPGGRHRNSARAPAFDQQAGGWQPLAGRRRAPGVRGCLLPRSRIARGLELPPTPYRPTIRSLVLPRSSICQPHHHLVGKPRRSQAAILDGRWAR